MCRHYYWEACYCTEQGVRNHDGGLKHTDLKTLSDTLYVFSKY